MNIKGHSSKKRGEEQTTIESSPGVVLDSPAHIPASSTVAPEDSLFRPIRPDRISGRSGGLQTIIIFIGLWVFWGLINVENFHRLCKLR